MDLGNQPTRITGDGSGSGPVRVEGPSAAESLQFLDLIGKGGFGAVYRAADERLGRVVAAKVLLDDREGRERFLSEAMITGNLQHPHILPVHSLAIDPRGRDYFTMPVVQGQNLGDIIHLLAAGDQVAAAEYTLPRLIAILVAVADAVTYAHARGVVHRDLKPQNIMLGHFGEVFVLDWGLAKLMHRPAADAVRQAGADKQQRYVEPLDADTMPSMSGTISGTPGYMAPEQARGDNEAVGFAADIYALGVILFQLLTLDMPVDTSTADSALLATIEGRLNPAHAAAGTRQVPKQLAAIAAKAMALDPAERYGGAVAMVADLRAWLEDREVAASPDGPLERTRRWLRRHRVVAALIAGTVVSAAMAAIVILTLSAGHHAERARLAELAQAGSERANQVERSERVRLERRAAAFREYLPGLNQVERAGQNSVWAKRAVATFDRALAIDPDFAEAHRGRAKALLLVEGDTTAMTIQHCRDAVAAYQRALELTRTAIGKDDPELLRNIGDVLWGRLRDFDGSRVWFQRAADADPLNPYAQTAKAILRSMDGDHPGAIADMRALAAREPDWWEVHESLGMLLLGASPRENLNLGGGPNGISDAKGAVAELTEALRLNPHRANLYLRRGQARTMQYFQGDTKEDLLTGCLDDYDTAVALSPDDRVAHVARLTAYGYMKDMTPAVKPYLSIFQQELDTVRRRWPKDPYALETRAKFESPANRAKVLAEIEAALAEDPDSKRLRDLRDRLQLELKPKAKPPVRP